MRRLWPSQNAVNRKVHVLRLHGQATTILHQIHTIHQHVGQRIATAASAPAGVSCAISLPIQGRWKISSGWPLNASRDNAGALQLVERQIRELKIELAHEDLLTMQRELGLGCRDRARRGGTRSTGHRPSDR